MLFENLVVGILAETPSSSIDTMPIRGQGRALEQQGHVKPGAWMELLAYAERMGREMADALIEWSQRREAREQRERVPDEPRRGAGTGPAPPGPLKVR